MSRCVGGQKNNILIYVVNPPSLDPTTLPILMYGSEIWGIDCNGKLDTNPKEGGLNKFLKWLLHPVGVNKYCNNNACRAETGRFPLRIKAQCITFKFWLTLAKQEETNCYKLSQVACNDIKWIKDKVSWSQKSKHFLYHMGLYRKSLGKSTFFRCRSFKHY